METLTGDLHWLLIALAMCTYSLCNFYLNTYEMYAGIVHCECLKNNIVCSIGYSFIITQLLHRAFLLQKVILVKVAQLFLSFFVLDPFSSGTLLLPFLHNKEFLISGSGKVVTYFFVLCFILSRCHCALYRVSRLPDKEKIKGSHLSCDNGAEEGSCTLSLGDKAPYSSGTIPGQQQVFFSVQNYILQ